MCHTVPYGATWLICQSRGVMGRGRWVKGYGNAMHAPSQYPLIPRRPTFPLGHELQLNTIAAPQPLSYPQRGVRGAYEGVERGRTISRFRARRAAMQKRFLGLLTGVGWTEGEGRGVRGGHCSCDGSDGDTLHRHRRTRSRRWLRNCELSNTTRAKGAGRCVIAHLNTHLCVCEVTCPAHLHPPVCLS
jgi:hypothetical protein